MNMNEQEHVRGKSDLIICKILRYDKMIENEALLMIDKQAEKNQVTSKPAEPSQKSPREVAAERKEKVMKNMKRIKHKIMVAFRSIDH